MAVLVKNIIPAKLAESSQVNQYSANNCRTIIDKLTVTNISANIATISINIVNSGGSVGNSNLIVKNQAIQPSNTLDIHNVVGHVIEDGGYISTIASASSALMILGSGREIT